MRWNETALYLALDAAREPINGCNQIKFAHTFYLNGF